MNQDDILNYLKENGPKTARQISDDMGINGYTLCVHHKLNRLYKYGLVEKIERENDATLWRVI